MTGRVFSSLSARGHSGLLFLIAASMTALVAGAEAPAAANEHSLYRSATRYPVEVRPVVEDLTAVQRRAQQRALFHRGFIANQALGDGRGGLEFPFAQEIARDFASSSQTLRQHKGNSPFTLMTPSPPADLQFDTNPDSDLNRPDSAIAAGPNDLVTAVNFAFQVQDLNGANPESTNLNFFFPNDPTFSVGDPRLSYDQTSGRFIMALLGFDYPQEGEPPSAGDSYCDVAISATSDPRGAWHKYTFHVLRGTEQMDFDSLGYDGKAIYVTARMRDFANNTSFSGNRMLILDKAKALAGQPLSPTIVDDLLLPGGGLAEIVKPVEPGQPVTPTSPAYFMCTKGNNKVALYTLTDPLGTPTFSAVEIPIPAWVDAGQAPQAGSATLLVQGAGFPLHKTITRDGVIWSCQSPSATGISGERAGVVVYRFDPVAGTLLGSHAISDPSLWYYLPAVVPDISGNAVVVFAGSDASHFASIYHARYVASMGDFEAPVLTAAGASSFHDKDPEPQNTEFWGDYLDAAPDVASGSREVWIHGELPVTTTVWTMRAARVPSTPRPIIGVNADQLDYGALCPGETKDKTLTVSNSGTADLHVSGIDRISGSTLFALVAGPMFPATIPPGGDADFTIRFTAAPPAETKTATFRISSDDPVTPTLDIAASGTVNALSLFKPPYRAFLPTVIQAAGPCFSELPLDIQNTGVCDLTFNALTITGADASEFTFVGLPPGGFPVTVSPGNSLGSGLAVQFRPTDVRRFHQAIVNATYVTDPGAMPPTTSTVIVPLYGEGVNTGARLLVTLGGVPVNQVEKLHLQFADPARSGVNEVTQNVPLTSVAGPVSELSFQYHREWGGASNPVGLAPDDYKVTVTIKVGKKQETKTVFFSVLPCGFNANVVASF